VPYSKSTLYALTMATEMALADGPVTVREVAARHGYSRAALAKVVQQLVRANVARGVRGVGGGYVLARKASEITVLEVIAIHDPPRRPAGAPEAGEAGPPHPSSVARLERLFAEVDELVSCTFASVTLETLAR